MKRLAFFAALLLCVRCAQAQAYKTCSAAYRATSLAVYDLEAAYSDRSDPDGSTRHALDLEAAAYFDAQSTAFYTVGSSQSVSSLCSAGNLSTLEAVRQSYIARAVHLRDYNAAADAAQAFLNTHR